MVRIYLTEGEGLLKALLERLHDREAVAGVTVLRGISGFGRSGTLHSSHLLDIAADLPLVVEFFDTPEKVREIIPRLRDLVEPGHLVSWRAELGSE